MKIYLLRHADPDYENDTITTPRGHDEAKVLADYLRAEGIDTIFSSPMGRAQATARYTAKALGLPVHIEPWTAELDIRRTATPPHMAWDTNGADLRTENYLANLRDDKRETNIAVPRCLMIGALPHLYHNDLEPTRAGIKANYE